MTDCAVLNELLAIISAMDATLTGKGAALKQPKTPGCHSREARHEFLVLFPLAVRNFLTAAWNFLNGLGQPSYFLRISLCL